MNAADYVGIPWRDGATGPDAFDCWGLVTDAAAALFGLALPTLAATIAGRRHWIECAAVTPGDVVALLDAQGHPYHVGLYLGAGSVLHTTAGAGARIEQVRAMAFHAPQWRAYRWAA